MTPLALPAGHGHAPDTPALREAFGRFATGVVLVTAAPDGKPEGLIVNSFASVSLEPPLVSFAPSLSSLTWRRMRRGRRLGINVLGRQHLEFARHAAPAGADRFAGIDWHASAHGVPRLDDALAYIECELTAEHVAGDHWIALGRVREAHTAAAGGAPLLYWASGYRRLAD